MSDLLTATKYIEKLDLTFEFRYRLNFMEEKSCGYSRIYKGKMQEDDENFEIFMEYYECGLTEQQALSRLEKLIQDVENGKVDTDF